MLDDSPETLSGPQVQALAPPRWPLFAILGISLLTIMVALVIRQPLVSAIAYAALLVVGIALIITQRVVALRATRAAGRWSITGLTTLDVLAIAALVVGCVVNGWFIAWEIASWEVWQP